MALSLLAGCTTPPAGPGPSVVVPPAEAPGKPVRIGLALGGGAARGFAHVGVIAVLEEAGLKPQLVVGTSAGSLVAALYASGKTSAQLQQTALNMEEVAITDWMLPIIGRGMFRGEALGRYVNELVAGRLMENMAIPLGIVATDLNSGQAVLFQRGDTGTAVRASSAVPAVFVPVKISGREYVDGGLVSPVPVRFARQMGADVVIAVDISSPPEANLASDTLQILLQTFAIMGKSINQYELRDADVVIRPSLTGLKSADFSARQRAIDSGRAAMLAALPQLKAKLAAAGMGMPK
ncbi:patatin-like phospholipase family protein [Polaromonas aquatica]|uniref:patatin-like phospholipase family protein n=1 Tax=Polaromonas aquatica TaxID=332657 RepID=UPI003D659E15